MRRFAAALVVLALALTGSAQAASGGPATSPFVRHSVHVAATFWHQRACPQAIVWVSWYYEGGLVGARAELPGCRIFLNAGNWHAYSMETRCRIMVHEYGHLLGYPHSEDPNSIMQPGGLPDVVPQCRYDALDRWWLHQYRKLRKVNRRRWNERRWDWLDYICSTCNR